MPFFPFPFFLDPPLAWTNAITKYMKWRIMKSLFTLQRKDPIFRRLVVDRWPWVPNEIENYWDWFEKMVGRWNYCSAAKYTFNSSSLALLLLIARAPNILSTNKYFLITRVNVLMMKMKIKNWFKILCICINTFPLDKLMIEPLIFALRVKMHLPWLPGETPPCSDGKSAVTPVLCTVFGFCHPCHVKLTVFFANYDSIAF